MNAVADHIEVQVTCGSEDEARVIADLLVDRRLAACVHLLPIDSVYVWDGAVQHDAEVLVVAKTRGALFDRIASAVSAEHSYDLPAITAVPMHATPEYRAWIDDSVT